MDAKTADESFIFRIFTACPQDIPTIIIDTRPQKEFKHNHICGAFCVRLSTNGQVLAEYSQSSYPIKWSQDCWWGRNVLVYGEQGLKKDHPVVKFLATQGKCKSLNYYKEGFNVFERKYPFLCTTSVKGSCIKKYPSQIVPDFLYLGDWDSATDSERLDELRVRRILTIHNHPERLRPPSHIRHLRQSLPDVEDADISQYFAEAYDFMEEARQKGQAVLVHCGAGVSRSATLVMMYLMRNRHWPAQRAKEAVAERRSLVCVNDGFWVTLCGLEAQLGIPPASRSDPRATTGFRGADASEPGAPPAVALSADAAGARVPVRMLSAKELQQPDSDAAKRPRADGEAAPDAPDAKRPRAAGTSGKGVVVVFEVRKPEGLVGRLELGPLAFTQRALLGRAPECDVVLEHGSISRQHAAISSDASGAAYVMDLGSGHGTKLGDAWIKPNTLKQLQPGQVLSFGASTRSYKVLSVTRE